MTESPLTQTAIDINDAIRLLRNAYGSVPARMSPSPLDELVTTILSQHTSDVNTERAFASLKRRFPRWKDVASANVADVEEAIRSGGLANIKAPVIQEVLRTINDRTGAYSLDFLDDMTDREGLDWLTALHGVGPKTAACVLMFSLGRPVMPVDTHVHRVATRLGILASRTRAEKAHGQLEQLIPKESMYDAHMLLIQHGRKTCRARSPLCTACVLETQCPSRRSSIA